MQAEQLAKALTDKTVKVSDRLVYALERAADTLVKKKTEAAKTQKEADELMQPLWDKAHAEVKAMLREQGIRNVDPRVYNQTVGQRMDNLLRSAGTQERAETLKKRAYGLGKTVESLERFISETRVELKARAAAKDVEDEVLIDDHPQEPEGSGKKAD